MGLTAINILYGEAGLTTINLECARKLEFATYSDIQRRGTKFTSGHRPLALAILLFGKLPPQNFGVVSAVMSPYEKLEIWW